MRGGAFTDHYPASGPFVGTVPYFEGLPPPGPQPSVRAASLPPVVAPAPGAWGRTKTATPPQAAPSWWARLAGK